MSYFSQLIGKNISTIQKVLLDGEIVRTNNEISRVFTVSDKCIVAVETTENPDSVILLTYEQVSEILNKRD